MPEDIAVEYYNIGNAYYDVGDFEKAIEYYSRALSDDHPYINKIRFNLAVAFTESGRVNQGLELFEELLLQDPDNLLVLESKAYALYLLGDDEGAVAVYDRILQRHEYNRAALLNKAKIVKETDIGESIKLLEEIYQIKEDLKALVFLGELYKENGQQEDFVLLYEEAVVNNPENPSILSGLAEYYAGEKLYFKAIEYYDRLSLIEDYDNIAEVLFLKAELQLTEIDDFKAGFETLIKALDAGFSDKQRMKALSESELLLGSVQLKEYLKLRNFL